MTTDTVNLTHPPSLGPALLRRLEHAVWIRRKFWSKPSNAGQRLIIRSIWVAFADCYDVGLRREALAILCAK